MRDDDLLDGPLYGPLPSGDWVTRRRQQLCDEAFRREQERERQEIASCATAWKSVAERMIARFACLPCHGEIASIPECSDAFAATCNEREMPCCPRQIVAADERRADEERHRRLEESGVPDPVIALLECGVKPTEATLAVDRLLAEKQALLVLSGKPGLGKSVAGGYAIWRRQVGRFVSASDLAKLSAFAEDDKQRLRQLERTALLVLDDLGTEFADAKGWATSAVDALLTTRYDADVSTVITTNLPLAVFIERYGPRVADRIAGNGDFIALSGGSLRQRA